MGTITDLDGGAGGASSYNDLSGKPVTTLTQTLSIGDNVINHNIGTVKSQTVVNVIVYDGTEEIPVSNWTITDTDNLTLPMTLEIVDARIEITSK